MLTWTDLKRKAVRLSRDTTEGTATQLAEDMNQGYQEFNAELSRYFSRKQQFTDVIEGESIYQTPVDAVRIIGMTVAVSDTYQTPVKEIRSEFQWRQITSYPYNSNWPAYYFVLGNDKIQLWPTPSQDVTNGLRYYYQEQDSFLSIDDIVSSTLSPAQTCTVTKNSATVTSTGATFTSQLVGLWFQTTGTTDLTWYEIVAVPDASTLTLKSAFVGISSAGLNFRIGQMPIIPGEYHDALVHYALSYFFEGKGNDARAEREMARFAAARDKAIAEYSSSTEGNVIFEDETYVNAWYLTPLPPSNP